MPPPRSRPGIVTCWLGWRRLGLDGGLGQAPGDAGAQGLGLKAVRVQLALELVDATPESPEVGAPIATRAEEEPLRASPDGPQGDAPATAPGEAPRIHAVASAVAEHEHLSG